MAVMLKKLPLQPNSFMGIVIGRKEEWEVLHKVMSRGESEFIAVYGRRRVGKTFLIRQFFNNDFDFYLTGVANATLSEQLSNFNMVLGQYDLTGIIIEPAMDWLTAFHNLRKVLTVSRPRNGKKKIIFLDELPWLDTPHSRFIYALEYFWNSWASAEPDIILIVCGSAASWMINKLIHNTGGLYNRVTQRIKLEPFTLGECEHYFQQKSSAYNRYQILQLYMALGGIPFYLQQVDTGKSAAQNIQNLCFKSNGILNKEFDALYQSLFTNADRHIAVIEALHKKAKGLTREELLKEANLSDGGGATRILKELEESDFIRRYKSFGKKERSSLYQLCDFYSLFYLRFIKNKTVPDDYNWLDNLDNPQQRTWAGYAFEQVCLAHIPQIKKALGISGVQTTSSSWISSRSAGKGAQVDLIIDRRDSVINLCEMKFSINPFTINKDYDAVLRNKAGVFREETKTRKSIFLTMITTFGLEQNMYKGNIQNDITMDALFEGS